MWCLQNDRTITWTARNKRLVIHYLLLTAVHCSPPSAADCCDRLWSVSAPRLLVGTGNKSSKLSLFNTQTHIRHVENKPTRVPCTMCNKQICLLSVDICCYQPSCTLHHATLSETFECLSRNLLMPWAMFTPYSNLACLFWMLGGLTGQTYRQES